MSSGIIEYPYSSRLAPHIKSFVDSKRSSGFIYNTEARRLYAFDRWLRAHPGFNTGELTKDIVSAWCVKRPTESFNSRNYRANSVRNLAADMIAMGHAAYVAPVFRWHPCNPPYVPGFDEFALFIRFVDNEYTEALLVTGRGRGQNSRNRLSSERLAIMLPVIFRMYFCTGMRVNEVTHLKVKNVNWNTGRVLIEEARNDKHRFVFIPQELPDLLKRCQEALHGTEMFSEWLFPSTVTPERHIRGATVTKRFRDAWLKCYPDSEDEGKRPGVRDLRNTFVVHRITRWCLEGKDVNALMPYLSRHLGHESIDETYGYFRQIEHPVPAVREFLNRSRLLTGEDFEDLDAG